MPGNITNFDVLDVIRCFLLLEQQRSRTFLTDNLFLGEGSIRSILDQLKEKGLIISSNKGHILSQKGFHLLTLIRRKVVLLDPILAPASFWKNFFPLFPKDRVICCQILQDYPTLHDIYLLRDHAIRKGADGALILEFNRGHLQFPGYASDVDLTIIERLFPFRQKGLVLIVVAESDMLAQKGMLNVLYHLTDFFNEFR